MWDLSCSIVLYNTPDKMISGVLKSLTSSNLNICISVIDNSPKKSEYDFNSFPNLTYLWMEENLGYGSSHNIAIKSMFGVSRYHLVLNPDIYFSPEVLQKLLNKMHSDVQIGLLMPKVISQDGNLQLLCRTLPCPLGLIARRFASNFKLHHFFKKNELSISSYDQQMNVPFLSGCFMFLRLDALLKVGIFDERFFMYAEDLDLSRRLHAEFKTIYYPSVSITHIHARDSYKNIRMLSVHALSMIRYFNKWGWFNDSERNAMNAKFLNTFS